MSGKEREREREREKSASGDGLRAGGVCTPPLWGVKKEGGEGGRERETERERERKKIAIFAQIGTHSGLSQTSNTLARNSSHTPPPELRTRWGEVVRFLFAIAVLWETTD